MTSPLDTLLRRICEGKLAQSAIHGYSQDDLERIASLGYAEIDGEGVWQKVLPTDAGKAFLAAGGFAAAHEKELAQKRQDEFLEFQRKFMDYQREMLEEQHRHIIKHDNRMLRVARAAAIAAFLSAAAAIATAYLSCSSDIRKEQPQSTENKSSQKEIGDPHKCYKCPFMSSLPEIFSL